MNKDNSNDLNENKNKNNCGFKFPKNKIFYILLIICILLFLIILSFNYNTNKNKINQFASFKEGPLLNYARISTSSYTLSNGKTLITGGDGGDGIGYNISNKAELYDPQKNEFTVINNTNFFHKKKVYLFEKAGRIFLLDNNPVEFFDIETNTFNNTNKCVLNSNCNDDTNYITNLFKAIKYSEHFIIIQEPFKISLYELETGNTVELPPMHIQRRGFQILLLKNAQILVLGGYGLQKNFIYETEIYNPSLNKFIPSKKIDIIPPILNSNPERKEFYTSDFIYKYDEENNIFKHKDKIYNDKNSIEIKLNDDFSLIYKKCNLFFCPMTTNIYDKNQDKMYNGPKLLYRPSYNSEVIETDKHNFLIYNNTDANDKPIKNTQILTIGG